MNRSTAVACFGIATLLLTTVGTQSGYACPFPPPQESALTQNIPSLVVEQGDVRDVLRQLFQRTRVSYTIAPEVQGEITISLKNITFDVALQHVLRQVDSTYRIEGGVFHIIRRIEDPAVLTDSPATFPGYGASLLAPTPPPAPSKETTSIVQDAQFLYIVRGTSMFKVRKSDMKVVAKGKLPG